MMGALLVFGYGPGISHAIAERFGREGYALAFVARNAERLAEGVARLKARSIGATAYRPTRRSGDDPADDRSNQEDLGTVSVVLWTAFRSGGVTNVLRPGRRTSSVCRQWDLRLAHLCPGGARRSKGQSGRHDPGRQWRRRRAHVGGR